MKIPPATDTFSDSYFPSIGMLTNSHSDSDFPDRPLPSLPKTKHRPVSDSESTKPRDTGCCDLSSLSGWPARIFIWNSFLRDSRWPQFPETIGIWKLAPLLERRALSLKGSQQPGRRNTPFWYKNGSRIKKLQGYVFRSSIFFCKVRWSKNVDRLIYENPKSLRL